MVEVGYLFVNAGTGLLCSKKRFFFFCTRQPLQLAQYHCVCLCICACLFVCYPFSGVHLSVCVPEHLCVR